METKRRASSPIWPETCNRGGESAELKNGGFFIERVCNFSLGFPAFRPSDFFEPRSKVVIRSEGYTWAPVSGSFNKFREVGVLSYSIYPLFKCFVNA